MKTQILDRLRQKNQYPAYLSNFDDLGTAAEISAVLHQLKQIGVVTYSCTAGSSPDDTGGDQKISAIRLIPLRERPLSPLRF